MKSIFSGIGLIILFVVILLVSLFGGLAYKYYMAPIHGKVDAEWKIESANSRIQNYNHFFDLCSEVQTMKTSIASQSSLLESAESAKERSRVRANLAGMNAQLANMVNQYNADSAKDYTAARFKASSLPFKLSIEGNTQCN